MSKVNDTESKEVKPDVSKFLNAILGKMFNKNITQESASNGKVEPAGQNKPSVPNNLIKNDDRTVSVENVIDSGYIKTAVNNPSPAGVDVSKILEMMKSLSSEVKDIKKYQEFIRMSQEVGFDKVVGGQNELLNGQQSLKNGQDKISQNLDVLIEKSYTDHNAVIDALEKNAYDTIVTVTRVGEGVLSAIDRNSKEFSEALDKFMNSNLGIYGSILDALVKLIDNNNTVSEVTRKTSKDIEALSKATKGSLDDLLDRTGDLKEIGGALLGQLITANIGYDKVRHDKNNVMVDSEYNVIINIESPIDYVIKKVSFNQQPLGGVIHNRGFVQFSKDENGEYAFTPADSLIKSSVVVNGDVKKGAKDVFTITLTGPEKSGESYDLAMMINVDARIGSNTYPATIFIGPEKISRDSLGTKAKTYLLKTALFALNYKSSLCDYIQSKVSPKK